MTANERRDFFIRYAWSFLGTYYSWGGDDPSGFDCSGYVIECLQAVGKFPHGHDAPAHGLMTRYTSAGMRVDGPDRGRLVFWNTDPFPNGRTTHVEICMNDELAIGAKGGGSNCRTKEDAIAMNAFIKVRPISDRGMYLIYVDVFNGA